MKPASRRQRAGHRPAPFDATLLDGLLVCTRCHAPLVRDDQTLVCSGADCRLAFAIRDEIPNMLLEEAVPLSLEEWNAATHRGRRERTNGQPASSP